MLLEEMDERARIAWAHRTFGNHLALTTSFGTYSSVMLHMISRWAPDATIISVDTGHNAETLAFAEQLIDMLGIRVFRYNIASTTYKSETSDLPLEEYLQSTKVETLENALKEHNVHAWMSGVQRHETDHRRIFQLLMRRSDGLYKFHPLLDWDSRKLYAYCKQHSLPINDNYIDPSKGADQSKECGIHLTGLANQSFTSSEL